MCIRDSQEGAPQDDDAEEGHRHEPDRMGQRRRDASVHRIPTLRSRLLAEQRRQRSGSGPVSYTHLDVYKRQGWTGDDDTGNAGRTGRSAADPRRLRGQLAEDLHVGHRARHQEFVARMHDRAVLGVSETLAMFLHADDRHPIFGAHPLSLIHI